MLLSDWLKLYLYLQHLTHIYRSLILQFSVIMEVATALVSMDVDMDMDIDIDLGPDYTELPQSVCKSL